jgi:hypothetical protein
MRRAILGAILALTVAIPTGTFAAGAGGVGAGGVGAGTAEQEPQGQRNPPRLVTDHAVRCRSPAGFLLEIDIRQRMPVPS